MMSVNLSHR